jgi:hypothetical protein
MDPLENYVECNNEEKAYIMTKRFILGQMRYVSTETCIQVKLYTHTHTRT